jgi:predicted Zn-dependent protease
MLVRTPRLHRALALLTPLILACAVNPATGERQLSLVSESQEIAMGQESNPQAAAFFGVYEDDDIQTYLRGLGAELAAGSERPQLPWTFTVADDPAVNAFAIPGGFIWVTRGIMASLNSEAELVGVLGHEVGHITARHSANQMTRQQLQQVGLGLGMVLSSDVRRYGGALATGLQILNLNYSRGDESQADELGVRYMIRVDYDPHALIRVMETLAALSSSGGDRVPEWQLTHPYPENRQENLQAIIARADSAGVPDRDDRDGYLRRLDGMTFGVNPREGFFEEHVFLHPDMQFRLDFPRGWATVNQKTAVAGQAPTEDAVLVLTAADPTQTPTEALDQFIAQEGIDTRNAREDRFNGLPAARVEFAARTESGVLQGEAAYVKHRDVLFQLIGYGLQSRWSEHAAAVGRSIESFQPLTDQRVLSVQPARLDVVSVPRSMTFEEFLREFPSSVEDSEVARINRLRPADRLDPGMLVKRVTGGPTG